jgi:hypothetical protein
MSKRGKEMCVKIIWGLFAGALMAVSVAWFAGTVYREGILFAPFAALVLSLAIPFLLYEAPAKRLVFALLTSSLLSGLSLLTFSLGGQAAGPTVFGLVLVALAIPVGIDLILQDFGTRLTIPPLFSRSAVASFLAAVLPLSAWIIAHEHSTAVAEDSVLIRSVAQNVIPSGDSIVFELVDPSQKDRLTNLVSVRTKEKTYSLSDAEVESVVWEERTVRRKSSKRNQSEVLSQEQAERMRLILSLQGAPVPDDIILFSHRGPITTNELKVSLGKKNPS